MTLLRILLLAILIYYGVTLLAGRLLRKGRERPSAGRRPKRRTDPEARYRDLTDQVIEDADYEEIDGEEAR
jgi:hypothetical protein